MQELSTHQNYERCILLGLCIAFLSPDILRTVYAHLPSDFGLGHSWITKHDMIDHLYGASGRLEARSCRSIKHMKAAPSK